MSEAGAGIPVYLCRERSASPLLIRNYAQKLLTVRWTRTPSCLLFGGVSRCVASISVMSISVEALLVERADSSHLEAQRVSCQDILP